MKKKARAKSSLLLSILLAMTLTTGCGTGAQTAATQAATAKGETTASASAETEAAAKDASSALAYLNTDAEYPIVKEPISIDLLYAAHPMNTDVTVMKVWERMETKTGIKMNLEIVPANSVSEKVNLRMASSTLPGIFLGGCFTNTELVKYAAAGALLPLDDLIAGNAPNVRKAFEDNPAILSYCQLFDGHVYALPRDEGSNGQHLFPIDAINVNKKWLYKLGMAIPTTYEEFDAMLNAFKEKDPNGNGQADEIPLGFAAGSRPYSMGAFASMGVSFPSGNVTNYLMLRDGKVVFAPVDNAYKEGLKLLQKWYGKGLIEQEAFTISPQNFNAKALTSIYGVIFTNIPTSFLSAQQCKEEYVTIAPLKAADGKQVATVRDVISYRVGAAISKDCKYPEAAIRWLDYFFTGDGYAEAIFGEPDVNWQKDAAGHYATLAPTDGTQMIQYMYQNNPRNWPGIEPKDFDADLLPDNKTLYPMLEALKPYESSEQYWPQLTFSPEDSETLSMYEADVQSYAKQKQAEFVMQNIDIDAEWDNYVAQYAKMGLEEMLQIYQTRYDEVSK